MLIGLEARVVERKTVFPFAGEGWNENWPRIIMSAIAFLSGTLSLWIIPMQGPAAIGAVLGWVVALSLLRVITVQSALIASGGVMLAVDIASVSVEQLSVPAVVLLALSLMLVSLRQSRGHWQLGLMRTAISTLLAGAGIALLASNPSVETAGAALFAVMLAGSILIQIDPMWPLGAGLTCLGSVTVFLAIGWSEIATQTATAALLSLLAASALLGTQEPI